MRWSWYFLTQVGSAFDGSVSGLAEERENCYLILDFMDEHIYVISSDDEVEEIEDPRRSLPQWAASERNSGG